MSYELRAPSPESRAAQFPDYPFESHYLSVNGHRMHYLDEGDKNAPPVVMVHGNPTWSFYYRRPVTALCDNWRCIVPDHIGMGLSEKPNPTDYGYLLRNRIDDLEKLLEQLEIRERITLLLHDWGGMIGMGYACRHPDRIASLIILNTAAFPLPFDTRFPWQLRLARSPLGPLLIKGFNAFSKAAVKLCVTRTAMSPRIKHAYLAPYDCWNNRHAILRFVQDIPLKPGDPTHDLVCRVDRELINFKSTPMLICWGMKDFVFTKTFLDQWQARFPGVEVHAFADAGHYLLEDAADEVIPIIRKFLNEASLNKSEYNQVFREA